MKKFISLMNAQSFYYLWKNKSSRKMLLKLLEDITHFKGSYKLIDTFNYEKLHIRSHILLETKTSIYLIDFNKNKNMDKSKMNNDILNFLKLTTNKKIYMILFCNFKGKNSFVNDVYYIYRNRNNSANIKLFMSKNLREQKKNDLDDVVAYLYNLNDEFYEKYLREIINEENVYKLLDI